MDWFSRWRPGSSSGGARPVLPVVVAAPPSVRRAGVPHDLACAMTDTFNSAWLADHLDLSGQMVFSFMGEEE